MRPRSASVYLLLIPFLHANAGERERDFFENRVRPILVENCQECHSESTKQKANLRLDTRDGWANGGDTGPALVPGKPEASLLMKAVEYLDPDLQMPPKRKLSDQQIRDLKTWIATGAEDPRVKAPTATSGKTEKKDGKDHWAWQPLSKPAVPRVQRMNWPATPVDSFILAKLETAGLSPNGEADLEILARRAYFDVTGLPPSPVDLDSHLANKRPEAHEQLVEKLLADPAYGEQFGQHWLDLTRYAETLGHEQDYTLPNAWRYRDYVIRAFNGDLPYDQLVTEHVAGDLLPEPRVDPASRVNESIQGTGFWHLGEATHSPVDIRGDECARVANQIDVFSKSFLALTVACARCHDHKFDPIPTKDYYALFGYLQSSSYQLADIADPQAQAEARKSIESLRAKHEPSLRQKASQWLLDSLRGFDPAKHPDFLARVEKEPSHPFYPIALHLRSQLGAKELLAKLEAEEAASVQREKARMVRRTELRGERNYFPVDRAFSLADIVADYGRLAPADWITSGLAFGKAPAQPGELLITSSQKLGLSLVEEPAAHSDLASAKFSGLIRTKTFEVTGDTLWIRYRGRARLFVDVDSHRVCQGPLHSDQLRKNLPLAEEFRWVSHNLQRYVGHRIHVEFTPDGPFALSQVVFGSEEPPKAFTLAACSREALRNPRAASDLVAAFRESWEAIVQRFGQGSQLTSDEAKLINVLLWELPRDVSSKRLETELADFQRRRNEIEKNIPAAIPALALLDGSAEREPVHIRGNHRTLSAEPVSRHFLSLLGGKAASETLQGSGRLELAKEMTGPSKNLLSRVIVNRVWHKLMGAGLVETVDNFGVTGAKPTHSELLDWLANDLIDHDWSLKHLMRRIMTSRTYRMASSTRDDHESADPKIALWHRALIRRRAAESIRDSILAVSGRLDRRLFGPSVPAHIPESMRSNRSPASSGPQDGNGRRGIYLEARRNHMDSFLLAFDRPTPFTTIGARNVSNSPAQPLTMLNSPFVHEQAGIWAKALLAQSFPTDAERIRWAYRVAFGRLPVAKELAVSEAFLADELAKEKRSREEAWADLAHTLLNVKEFPFLH